MGEHTLPESNIGPSKFWGKGFRTDYDFWCPFFPFRGCTGSLEILLFSSDHGSGTMADLVIQLKPIGTTVPFFQL